MSMTSKEDWSPKPTNAQKLITPTQETVLLLGIAMENESMMNVNSEESAWPVPESSNADIIDNADYSFSIYLVFL